VSKEVTAEVKRLLEHHREQEKALLQAALQAAQQALQQAAERAAEHKVEIEQLKAEIAEMKVKMATLKQRPGATRPGEPQPPPAWMPNTEVHTRQEKLLSSLVEQLRGGVAESKAAQLEVVGKIGHVAGKLDQVTDRLSFLEQERRPKIGGPSRPPSTSRVSQQGKSPTFSFSADAAVAGIFAHPPVWPPTGVTTSVEWSKLTGTLSPIQFGQPETGAVRVATVPFSQLVPETLPDPQSTGGKGEEEVCHFSDLGSNGEGSQAESEEDGTSSEEEPEEVLEVTTKLDSGSTTPTKPRSVPAPNVRACSKSSPPRGGPRARGQRRPGTPRAGTLR
jgi:hypothetical protein